MMAGAAPTSQIGTAPAPETREGLQDRLLIRPQKITLGDMRSSGVRGLLIYCADYKCSHWIGVSTDQWSDAMCGCPISKKSSAAPPAASAVPTSGRISTGTKKQVGEPQTN
jgi:hypothetical protein